MKLNKNIVTSGLVLGAVGASFLGAGGTGTANASSSVRKDIAIAGAATAIYGLLDHNNTAAVVGGVVTAGALAGGGGYGYYDYRYDHDRDNRDRGWHGDRNHAYNGDCGSRR